MYFRKTRFMIVSLVVCSITVLLLLNGSLTDQTTSKMLIISPETAESIISRTTRRTIIDSVNELSVFKEEVHNAVNNRVTVSGTENTQDVLNAVNVWGTISETVDTEEKHYAVNDWGTISKTEDTAEVHNAVNDWGTISATEDTEEARKAIAKTDAINQIHNAVEVSEPLTKSDTISPTKLTMAVQKAVDKSYVFSKTTDTVLTSYHQVTVNNVTQAVDTYWKGHKILEAEGGAIKVLVKGTDITEFTKKSGVLKKLSPAREILFSNHVDPEHLGENVNVVRRRMPGRKQVPKKKIIALYHVFHGGIKNHALVANKTMGNCTFYKNCVIKFISKISDEPVNADAVLFQGNNMPKVRPKRRDSNQVFVFHSVESPQYLHFTKLSNTWFQNYFNWTMTYRHDSDIPFPYGSVIPKSYVKIQFIQEATMTGTYGDLGLYDDASTYKYNTKGIPGKDYAEIFRRKTRHAAWLVSHCQTASKREWLVNQMQQYTRIDKIGACSRSISLCPKGKACDDFIVDSYKFYIAFENSICSDYITEKVFKWYSQDIIMVVRGARHYHKYLPNGTYVDADHFRTPKELAEYLNKLGANKEAYLQMLKRKDNFIELTFNDHSHIAYCHLCYRLNNLEQFRKSISNIHTWWDQGVCKKPTANALLDFHENSRQNSKVLL